MDDEPTKDEVERRAREVARAFMSIPYRKQDWEAERKIKDQASLGDASTPRTPGSTDEAS